MALIEIETEDEFLEELAKDFYWYTVVIFSATWCGPCKRLTPLLESFSMIYTRLNFLRVDIDKLQEVSGRYAISTVPSFFIFSKESSIPIITITDGDVKTLEAALKTIG
jgi:thioredoxin-like negative regulator of GroEL